LASTASSIPPSAFFIVLLFILILVRLRRIINGSLVSVGRTVAYSAYYIGFSALVLSSSFFSGVQAQYFVVYIVVALVAAFISYRAASTRMVYTKLPDGSIFAKGGRSIYFVYLGALAARIIVGYVLVGSAFFYVAPGSAPLSSAALAGTIAIDLFLVFGVGLLFGRNMQIMRKYRAYKIGKESIPDASNEGQAGPSGLMPS
jgi:hypothetical protein